MVDLGRALPIKGVSILPRASSLAFPVDFSIQVSDDASNWSDVPGQAHTNFPKPAGPSVDLAFSSPTPARFLRLNATRLGPDDFGNHYLQIAELIPAL